MSRKIALATLDGIYDQIQQFPIPNKGQPVTGDQLLDLLEILQAILEQIATIRKEMRR